MTTTAFIHTQTAMIVAAHRDADQKRNQCGVLSPNSATTKKNWLNSEKL